MKKLLYIMILFVSVLSFTACGSKDDGTVVKPSSNGTMTDKEGNTYKWVRIGNLDWMAENLKCGTPYYDLTTLTAWGTMKPLVEITNFGMAQQYFKTFGNYYNYSQAVENCPEGWRLPTDEDWKELETTLGMSQGDADNQGWRNGAAFLMAQTEEQGTGLYFLFGGELCKWGYMNYNDGTVKTYRQYDEGMYWTSTVDKSKENECVYYRKIMPNINQVERHSATTFAHYFSVRYVRDSK